MSYPEIFIKEIQKLYREGMTQKEIAKALNCSLSTVERAVKKDPEYATIKQKKKEKTLLRLKEIEKQKKEEEERDWWAMVEKQEIHAFMISKKRKISRAQLVELSLSQYVEVGGKLKYIDPHHKPADLPRTYDVHNIILPQFKDYTYEIESEKWTSKVEKETLK